MAAPTHKTIVGITVAILVMSMAGIMAMLGGDHLTTVVMGVAALFAAWVSVEATKGEAL